MNWTDKQRQAFSLRNKEILVSAAAGSGKTAVMVERILRIVTEEPYVDIDRLLIVTFTKKAAESMRVKIRKELEKRLREDPSNEHLQKQMLLINHAYISTIDSFCSFIVRNYFYLTTDVSSNFRIGNESEIKLIQADVLKEVLEEEYERGDENFLSFVDYFATGKNDLPLEDVILSLYRYSQSHKEPKKWLNDCVNVYDNFTLDSCGINNVVKNLIDTYVNNAIELEENMMDIASGAGGPYMYCDNFTDDIRLLEEIRDAETLEESISLLYKLKFSTLSRKKGNDVSDELRAYCKSKRDTVKKNISDIAQIVAYADSESVFNDILKCKPQALELVRVCLKFSEKLLEYKKKKNIFDHSDVAHIALDILRQENSPAKKQLSELFDEIFIDEYQDSNRLQEELLYSVATEINGAHKVFMVGDVKQSIYSFRMACPDLFINKLNSFSIEESPFCKVFLSNNFRSRKQVVDFVNLIFGSLMEKSISGIDYDESQRLVYSASYSPETDDEYKPEILLFEKEDEDISPYEAEAYMIGSKINELLDKDKPFIITDRKSGEKRNVRLSDICILVRSQKDVVYPIKKVLEDEFGIPVISASSESFFESFEVGLVVNYLKILDNSYNDIPLTSVLLSPIVGLSTRELAVIRAKNRKSSVYDLIVNAACDDDTEEDVKFKLNDFLNILLNLREELRFLPVHKLVWEIYEQTGIEAFVSAMPVGEKRLRNLKRFVKYCIDFENTEYHTLFDFLRYIEKVIEYDIQESSDDADKTGDNAVRIMTMHKSKGLEFPVCILAGLNRQFNFSDERAGVLLHPEFGIGFDSIDTVKRTRRKSLIKRLINKQMHVDKYGEEIRILYVAMTRAEEKLILTCCHDGKYPVGEEGIGYFDILNARRYWDWLSKILSEYSLMYNIKHFDYDDFIRIHEENELKRKSFVSGEEIVSDSFTDSDLIKKLDFAYEGKVEEAYKKISVTVLKEQYNLKDEEGELQISENLIEKEVEFPLIPEFLKETKGLSGAKRGLIYHSVLEHWDYKLSSSIEDINDFCKKLYDKGIFTDEELAVINPVKIKRFLDSSIGLRMKKAFEASLLKREASFSVILEHGDERFSFMDKDVLLQGIIDAYLYEDDELVIVDYKTDYLPDGNINHLSDKYAMQLKCYSYALEKITKKKVKECWIYSLYCDDSVRIIP